MPSCTSFRHSLRRLVRTTGMARESTRVTSRMDLRSKFRCRVLSFTLRRTGDVERNQVRSEVADTDTGERADITNSKRAFYGNVIFDM